MEFARWQFVGLMTPTETQGTMTNANVTTKFQAFESKSFTFARTHLSGNTCAENTGISTSSPSDLSRAIRGGPSHVFHSKERGTAHEPSLRCPGGSPRDR